jgi:penicillin-binding protein 1A
VLVNWQRGSVAEGGSTLTMQLVKNIFLSQQRKFSRKVAEAVLAIRLEQILTKIKFWKCTQSSLLGS